MASLPCELDGGGIVVLGSMNPSIFQPAWFAAHNLLRQAEADAAKIEVVSHEMTSFVLSWLRVYVVGDRIAVISTSADGLEPMRDLVAGIFTLLEHTPVSAVGLNRYMHYRVSSLEAWHEVGHRLAPKEPWKGLLANPGMLTVRMSGRRPDETGGNVNVKVEPSYTVRPHGVFVEVNEHYDRPGAATSEIVELIKTKFDDSMTFARQLGDGIVDKDRE